MIRLLLFLLTVMSGNGLTSPGELRAKIASAASTELPSGAHVIVKESYCRFPVPLRAAVTIVNPHPPLGVVSFEAHWLENGHPKKVFGSATLKVTVKVAVAKSVLKHRDVIQPDSITFVSRELSSYSATGFFTEPARVVGRRVRGMVRIGEVLGIGNTEEPAAVEAGETAELIHQGSGFVVSARVRALQSGTLGQWVRVENPSTKKSLMARVTGSGKVSLR